MTREQMIDEAVRDYMEYLDSTGNDSRTWIIHCMQHSEFLRPYVDWDAKAAIRFAYWKIKAYEEYRQS